MRKVIFSLIFFLLLVSFYSKVSAQTPEPSEASDRMINGHKAKIINDSNNAFKTGLGRGVKTPSGTPAKFNEKLCEAHIKVAKHRVESMGSRAEKMKLRLDAIVILVEKFYTNKLIPKGITVSNYTTLVADVNAKKAALAPLVTSVKGDAASLTCDNGAATGQFADFRTDAQGLLSAFKDYKASVIALTQAVKKAAGESLSVTPTLSPSLTVTPTP